MEKALRGGVSIVRRELYVLLLHFNVQEYSLLFFLPSVYLLFLSFLVKCECALFGQRWVQKIGYKNMAL
jgi:hypothetical protein